MLLALNQPRVALQILPLVLLVFAPNARGLLFPGELRLLHVRDENLVRAYFPGSRYFQELVWVLALEEPELVAHLLLEHETADGPDAL